MKPPDPPPLRVLAFATTNHVVAIRKLFATYPTQVVDLHSRAQWQIEAELLRRAQAKGSQLVVMTHW